MAKDRNKLHYVRGYCELEKGMVTFIGGMYGVSRAQTWYHVIYAIKDKFKYIDFWIDPQFEECHTLPSTDNHLRNTVCKTFTCKYEEFPNGEIRPKRKLSELDKRKYDENRSKVNLGINIEFTPVAPTFGEDMKEQRIISEIQRCLDVLNSNEIYDLDKVREIVKLLKGHRHLLNSAKNININLLLEKYDELRKLAVDTYPKLQKVGLAKNLAELANIPNSCFFSTKILKELMKEEWEPKS